MSDNLIMLSIVLVVLAGIATPFIRKAISHRKAIGAGTPEKEIEIRVQPADNIYFLRYILTYKAPFKSSKTVRIRPEYVDAIRKACRIIKGGKTTVTAYVDKVLEAHFTEHADAIDRLYREKRGESDKSGE